LKSIIFKLNIVLCVLVILTAALWQYVKPFPLNNLIDHAWLWIFPLIAAVGLIGQFWIHKFKKDGMGFLFSCLFIMGSFASTVASLFPNVLPSTNSVNPSLTIYNVAAHEYGLSVGMYWFIIAFILVIIYFIIQFRVFKGKLDDVGYGDH